LSLQYNTDVQRRRKAEAVARRSGAVRKRAKYVYEQRTRALRSAAAVGLEDERSELGVDLAVSVEVLVRLSLLANTARPRICTLATPGVVDGSLNGLEHAVVAHDVAVALLRLARHEVAASLQASEAPQAHSEGTHLTRGMSRWWRRQMAISSLRMTVEESSATALSQETPLPLSDAKRRSWKGVRSLEKFS
jgi:hypothetical protein